MKSYLTGKEPRERLRELVLEEHVECGCQCTPQVDTIITIITSITIITIITTITIITIINMTLTIGTIDVSARHRLSPSSSSSGKSCLRWKVQRHDLRVRMPPHIVWRGENKVGPPCLSVYVKILRYESSTLILCEELSSTIFQSLSVSKSVRHREHLTRSQLCAIYKGIDALF